MPAASSEITRDELLARLRRSGARVSSHQLLRWHHVGLMPQPRREGLGRGKGTTSYYHEFAVLQAWALADLLRKRRNLTDVGWGVWVWGFPVTEWARELLIGELEIHYRQTVKAKRKLDADLRKERPAQRRVPVEFKGMLEIVGPEGMPRLLQMLNALPLGTLQASDYHVDEWDIFQGAILHQVWPKIASSPELPSPAEVATGMAVLSSQINLPRIITELKAVPNRRLAQYRNEAQWLVEQMTPNAAGPILISPDEFLTFFKYRHLIPEHGRDFEVAMKAAGYTHPPHELIRRQNPDLFTRPGHSTI